MINNEIIHGFDDEKDESLKIKIQKLPDLSRCLLIILNGYIDTYNSVYFQKQIQRVIESGYIQLIFECNGLNYVSSTGIGSFTTFLKTVKPKGGDLVLVQIQPKVYEVFQLLGFSQFFIIKDQMENAIEYFKADVLPNDIPLFPLVFSCSVCTRKLKAVKPGRFRCSECKTILEINEEGIISLS